MTPFQALYTAHKLSAQKSADRLVTAYASSDIEIYPYQIAAASFALRSPFLKGVILADEGSLGKTYEALLVISQLWAEGKERILIVVPTPLLMQWEDVLNEHFTTPFVVVGGEEKSFEHSAIVLTTYDFAVTNADKIEQIVWDVIVFEEAHRLSNRESKQTTTLKNACETAYKILLTATPMQNSIMDLYGLIDFIDTNALGDADAFYRRYFRKPENYLELTSTASRYCFRTLRSQVERYVKIPNRIPVTVNYEPTIEEEKLAKMVEIYLKKNEKTAFPKMDNYDLTLMFNRALSSSNFALSGLVNTAIGRVREPELIEIAEFSETLKPQNTAKGQALLKALKIAFSELKKCGANRKAVIFTENRSTLEFLNLLLSETYKILNFNGSKSSDYSIIKNFRDEAEILITTDIAAEGFNFSFCSFIVNFDLPYNVLTLEQRIMRCHRQGQENDVIVLNFLNKKNFADVRMLELINKRVAQFDGVIGMSDDVIGNFCDDISLGITNAFAVSRHKNDIESEFKAILLKYENVNTESVHEAENVLFTTFTRDIAEKIMITPQYIKDKTAEINAELWALTKCFFQNKKGYQCIDETRTLKIGIHPQKVFTGGHLGRREYLIDDKTLPKSGWHTLTGVLAKNIISEIFWVGVPDKGSVIVEDLSTACKVGFYQIKAKPKDVYFGGVYYYPLVGAEINGTKISESECRDIMNLPVLSFTAFGENYGERDVKKEKSAETLDNLIDKTVFIRLAAADTDDARREEIEAVKTNAYRRKQALSRNIEVMRGQLRQIEHTLSHSDSITEKISAEKKKATMSREIRTREQSLFMDEMRLDVETESKIKALTDSANLTIEIKRYFVIEIKGG